MFEIRYPTGFGSQDIVAWRNSGLVCLDRSSGTVIKSPHDDRTKSAIAMERRIYERFRERGEHDGLLRYYGPYESGIRLEYARNFDLRSFLRDRPQEIQHQHHLTWAAQVSSALSFVHSCGVIHGDLTCSNVFLDDRLDAKLGDFGGSSLDGSALLVGVTASHRYPGSALSIQGDIFALGSTLYEIMTGAAPYESLSEEEILARYAKAEFPRTAGLGPLGDVITSYWRGHYKDADAVLAEIRDVQQREASCRLPSHIEASAILLTIAAVIVLGLAGLHSARCRS